MWDLIVSVPDHCLCFYFIIPPQTMFVGGILFSRCPSVRDVLVFL